MPDRFYGGFRAGRTQASLAVLLRRDDTNKGKTGAAPLSPPLFGNAQGFGGVNNVPAPFSFTPTGSYGVLKWAAYNQSSGVDITGVACVPASGPTVNLARIGSNLVAANSRQGMWGGAGFVPGTAYTVTITWAGALARICGTISAYSGVGSVGTPVTTTGTGPLSVAAGSDPALVIDIIGLEFPGGAGATVTPTAAGQTLDMAKQGDGTGAVEMAGSKRSGTGSVAMTWTITPAAMAGLMAVPLLPVPGLVMTAAYARQGAAPVDIPLVALASPSAAWAAGGWAELDATKCPGLYRLDLPDAAVASGVDWLAVEVVAAGAFEYVERLALETRRSLRRGAPYPGLTFFLQNADGTPHTGGTVTAVRFLDGAASAPMANPVVEKSGGVWAVDLAAADTDALFGCYLFTASGAIPRAVLLIFEP
jgi:hypothetical protein